MYMPIRALTCVSWSGLHAKVITRSPEAARAGLEFQQLFNAFFLAFCHRERRYEYLSGQPCQLQCG